MQNLFIKRYNLVNSYYTGENMLIKLLFLSIFISFSYANSQIPLTIEGTGDSQELLRGLAKIYKEETGNIVVIPDSIGSGGGIKKLIKGDIKIARVARALKDKEKVHELSYKLFAYSPIVFVLNTDVKNEINLNTEDILNIFNYNIDKWEMIKNTNLEGKIYVINREKGDSSRSVLEKHMKGFKDIKEMTGITANYNSEAIKLLLKYNNTIGYLSMPNTLNTNLKIVSVDNIFPSIENIMNHHYKLTTPLGFVFKGKLEKNAKSFLDFLKTSSAKAFMIELGVVPAS